VVEMSCFVLSEKTGKYYERLNEIDEEVGNEDMMWLFIRSVSRICWKLSITLVRKIIDNSWYLKYN
jgi:hypothetical protein